MSLFAVDLLASSYQTLLIVAIWLLAPPTVVCCLVDPTEEHGHFLFSGCYGIQRVCARVWASPHPCHSCVLSNLLILNRRRVKYGELHLTFISTGKFPIVILNFFSNFNSCKYFSLGFPGGVSGKEPACQCRRYKRCRFNPWTGKIPWRRKWQPTSVFFPGKSHGQRSLAGYGPWGRPASDMLEVT